jgi:hypothetical protein
VKRWVVGDVLYEYVSRVCRRIAVSKVIPNVCIAGTSRLDLTNDHPGTGERHTIEIEQSR